MFIGVLNIVHNATTLLFGVFASAAFLGIRLNRKNKSHFVIIFPVVSGAIRSVCLPLIWNFFFWAALSFDHAHSTCLLLTLYYKYNAAISILSVLIAYLCCQISNWIGIAAFALTNQQWIYYSVRICVTAIVFVLLIHYVSYITAQLLQKPTRSLMILGFMPFVYYIFDYVTSIYTSLLYSGLEIVGEFLGFVLCLTYLMFLFLYFKEYEANKEAEQRNQIIEMKRVQSEKELEALHRSERAVSTFVMICDIFFSAFLLILKITKMKKLLIISTKSFTLLIKLRSKDIARIIS